MRTGHVRRTLCARTDATTPAVKLV